MTNGFAFQPSRRQVIRSLVGGSILMPGILSGLFSDAALAQDVNPLAPRPPHFGGRAKRVIFMYMSGGVSHMDSFDPKPRLKAEHGKGSGENGKGRPYLRTFWDARPGGKCGTEISDLFPNVRECVDDLCVIRSMRGDHNDHFQATLGIHTGSVTFARPSIGSWVSYGLGTLNQNLPSFVVLAPELPYAGSQVWSSDFLPGCHQGMRVLAGAEPIPDLARRMAERGVRFIELIDSGSNSNWDSHADMAAHGPLAKNVDKPISGLIRDLKSRGMLDDTLVVWTTEFGRTPTIDGRNGRSHFNVAFSSWMAGGGVKGGITYGRTDDFGAKIVENPVHVHDFHATILHLLGLDHEKLTYRHAGRDFRLTDVAGEVVTDILA